MDMVDHIRLALDSAVGKGKIPTAQVLSDVMQASHTINTEAVEGAVEVVTPAALVGILFNLEGINCTLSEATKIGGALWRPNE